MVAIESHTPCEPSLERPVSIHVYMYICMHIQIYVHTYNTYIYIRYYVYIYIYIYTHIASSLHVPGLCNKCSTSGELGAEFIPGPFNLALGWFCGLLVRIPTCPCGSKYIPNAQNSPKALYDVIFGCLKPLKISQRTSGIDSTYFGG